MRRTARGLLPTLVAIGLLLGDVNSAAQIATATLAGVIRDETGGALPGVTVTVRSAATGAVRTATTDSSGRYRIAALEPGEYGVRAELANFRPVVRTGVILTVGGTTDVEIAMSVGAITEQVTVVTQAPLIEPSAAAMSRVVSTVEIESLPISGRNFVDFVKLSSGVAVGRENIGGGAFKEPDVGVGSAAAPRLSFGGQAELNTMVQVDGADNIQTFTGLPRATPSQEAAKEFRVLNSTYLAEYGRALGGFVNIVTKSGTNNVDGSIYYFGMHDALAARSALSTPDGDVLRQNQFGLTFGAPIVADRTFVFANYEGQVREQSNRFSQVVLDNLPALNAVRAQFGLAPETTDQLQQNHYNAFMVKLDNRRGEHTLSTRVNFLHSDTDNFLGGGGRASPTSSTARDNVTTDVAVVPSVVSVFSPTLVNEARFQGAYRTFDFPSLLKEPALEIANFIIMGKSTSDVDYYSERRFQFSDSLTRIAGAHQIKAGVDLNFLRNTSRWHLFFPARIIFPSLAAFQSFTPVVFWWPYLLTAPTYPGISTNWTTDVPDAWSSETGFEMSTSSYGFFAQDQWQASSRLSLTYGLRYDFEIHPDEFITERDLNNLQPRVGAAFAYSPRGVVRAGYGLFHDRLASSSGQLFNATQWSSAGSLPNAQRLFPTIAPLVPRFQQRIVAGPAAPAAARTFLTTGQVPVTSTIGLADTLDGAIDTPFSHQASAQISHEVGGGIAVSAGYLYLGARDILGHTGNLNAFQTAVLATGKPIWAGRTYPDVGALFVQTNTGTSNYHGATFEVERRLSGGLGFHGSYTLSRVRNNVDSLANLADLPEGQDIEGETARSRQDVRHRFTLSVLTQVPSSVAAVGGIRVSSLVSLESGRPFNIFSGADSNADGNPNSDRPGLIGRNAYEGPGYASVDLRVGREFTVGGAVRLDLMFDVFNLFNRVNVKDINTVWGGIDYPNTPPPSQLGFGSPRDVFNPRQMQFAAKLRF
ncbi:MAG TPA: TonB-dependent receptor [Vicinamibacterales bacterium]|nr:TonB-dependent receptor [Vicinamibacterales bacterium]